MNEVRSPRRFRMSIKALMIAVALCALVLAPIAWLVRHTEAQVMAEKLAAESARLQAVRARDAALAQAAKAASSGANPGSGNQAETGAQALERQESLWAGLSVNRPLFKLGQTKDLSFEFTLVNDGDKLIDPEIAESRIVINGKELAETGSILGKAASDARFKELAPGKRLEFACSLGNYFNEPGIYRVSWKGANFQSPEIVVRIMAAKDE
jgi:hypothetical protein